MNSLKILLIVTLFLSLVFCLAAQEMDWEWVCAAGGISVESGWFLAVDNLGFQYVTGYFTNTADFGSTNLTSCGDRDIYVAKLDSDGNWLWAVQAGGTDYDQAYGINLDDDGNVYVIGEFAGTATFGTTTLTSSGGSEIFLSKLDGGGNWLWTVQAGGVSSGEGYGVTCDSSGNIYISGGFLGMATFGTTTLTSSGSWDIFVAKLNSDGNWIWAKRAGGAGDDNGTAIALDGYANVYLTGWFHSIADFGTTSLTCNGAFADLYVAKLDSDGNWQWAKRAGGTNGDIGYGIAADESGSVYLTGLFRNTADFGPFEMTSFGSNDIFVAKLDSDGTWHWVTRGGGVGSDTAFSIILDNEANCYLIGFFTSNATFGTTTLISSGSYDVITAKLDSDSNWLWAKRAGGPGDDFGNSIGTDISSNVYLAGEFEGIVDFGPIDINCSGGCDIFVAKLHPVTGVEDDLMPSAEISLNVYPNPFTSESGLAIKGRLKTGEKGKVSIYNQRGQLIRKYTISSGTSTIHWNGLDSNGHACSSGIYFCRLQTDLKGLVRKVVLLK